MASVLVVTQRFYPPWSDGTLSYAKGLVDVISRMSKSSSNPETTILSLTAETLFAKAQNHELKEYLKKRNVNFEWYLTSEGFQQINLWEILRKISKKKNYDIVHLVYNGFNPFLMRIGATDKNRSIIAKHLVVFPFHPRFTVEKNAYGFFTKTRIFQKFNINLVFSSEALQNLYNVKEGVILPPAIDTNLYSPDIRSPDVYQTLMNAKVRFGDAQKVLQKDVVVLYMGPLSYERFDYPIIIGAFRKLCREYGVDAGLVIVGRGFENYSFLEGVERYVDKNGLTERVFICLRELMEIEKNLLFNNSDVFVYPVTSRLRQMSIAFPPIALLETMSTGLCVVCGGLPSLDLVIKNHENGVLLESEISQETIAEGMWAALSNKRKISQNARLTIEKNFSVERVSKLYGKFLAESYGKCLR